MTPCAANVSLHVGGVCIIPGDYIYADRAGAVVIPAHSLRDVLSEARRIAAEDRGFVTQIHDEDPTALRAGEQHSDEQ